MASNQEALRRYRVIHNILRRGGKHKTSTILEACQRSYIRSSIRTIQKDLEDLAEDQKLGFFLPIKKDTATKTYYYTYIPDHIFPSLELERNEINALLFYAKTINQYDEYPLSQEISNAVKKVVEHSNIPPKTRELFEQNALLETEKHPPINGIELIIDLLEAISNRKVIIVRYKKFQVGATNEYRIKPILLKEEKQLWYILGEREGENKIITLALDRIISLTISNKEFDPIAFNSKEYFKYSFGITVIDIEPVNVIISFNPDHGDYIKTLPIHNSQTILEDNENRFVISINVKPSYEFYSKILSYGDNATIISPPEIREWFRKSFERAFNNYK